MKDIERKITYKDTEYTVVFNLNVMEALQDKFGSMDAWVDLVDGTANARKVYKEAHGSLEGFDDSSKDGEPDIKALIFGYYVMLNEGIEIDNEENGKDLKPVTEKQVGKRTEKAGRVNGRQHTE